MLHFLFGVNGGGGERERDGDGEGDGDENGGGGDGTGKGGSDAGREMEECGEEVCRGESSEGM